MKVIGWILIVFGLIGGMPNIVYFLKSGSIADVIIMVIITIAFVGGGMKLISKSKSRPAEKKKVYGSGGYDNSDREPKKKKKERNPKKPEFINPYVDVNEMERTGELKIIQYDELILKKDEAVYFATPAYAFTTKQKTVGYQGGSAGASVRVAKGLTLRGSSYKGTPIRQDVNEYSYGDYVVTNKRALFLSEKNSFDIPLEKINSLKLLSPVSFAIITSSKAKNIEFDESQIKYAYNSTLTLIEQLQ